MKHFYKLNDGQGAPALMNALMHHQHLFTKSGIEGVSELTLRTGTGNQPAASLAMPIFRRAALAVMSSVEGTELGGIVVLRGQPKTKIPLANPSPVFSNYLLPLHAGPGLNVLAGDEAIELKSGDVWWADLGTDAVLINNSDDEMFLMLVEVRIEP